MIFRKSIVLTSLLLLSPLATAQLLTLIDAIELAPANIILPGTQNGMVTYKPCVDECDEVHERARLTEDTEFYVDDTRVKYDAFKQGISVLKNNPDSYALISVDTKLKTITSIRING
tara:strand:+ start:646 stop:996 length:351 start_codon:yes stop_codon:yes gene_type:complete